MRNWRFLPLLLLAMAALAGCMQTRHVEVSSVSTCSAGPCPSASHEGTYSERRWCGLWPCQPARIQP
jgi:hypothetical protein